ncbi:outer membrane protein with beta-barrel domain [Jejuia pallidilutea]|uniref:Outer membrane protein with beta-barrel domain n=1 Tax=Jejuia pallidilutea TaxID=504487 RepID=A0A362WZD8_9FLAO|nr:outer membrane beta-barrel protein [Jejuia pallidilutea]PQV47810.1 outer membrane protein with beta-barrel domain [Jejuia pallidilutea]
MKKLKFIIVVLSLAFYTISSFSQNKWSAEFRPNIDFPTKDFVDSNIKTGFGFEIAVNYRFMEHLGAYVGWGYNNFNIKDSDIDFDETGYTFGLQFIHPIASSQSLSYLFRAGAIYNHIEVEDNDGNIIDDSGHGLGWEVGAGLNYHLGSNWNLRPQIGYRALSRNLNIEGTKTNIDVNYIAIGIGIAKTF